MGNFFLFEFPSFLRIGSGWFKFFQFTSSLRWTIFFMLFLISLILLISIFVVNYLFCKWRCHGIPFRFPIPIVFKVHFWLFPNFIQFGDLLYYNLEMGHKYQADRAIIYGRPFYLFHGPVKMLILPTPSSVKYCLKTDWVNHLLYDSIFFKKNVIFL